MHRPAGTAVPPTAVFTFAVMQALVAVVLLFTHTTGVSPATLGATFAVSAAAFTLAAAGMVTVRR